MGVLDQHIRRYIPGKTPSIQAIVVASALVVALAYPVFNVAKDGRQGHDLFSQEKPEAIAQGQEQSRKDYLESKKAREKQQ
jgi:hypothetical protein